MVEIKRKYGKRKVKCDYAHDAGEYGSNPAAMIFFDCFAYKSIVAYNLLVWCWCNDGTDSVFAPYSLLIVCSGY